MPNSETTAIPNRPLEQGMEWIVDVYGCAEELLKSDRAIGKLFERIVVELELKPVDIVRYHVFPPPGGITAVLMLSESHLTCHTFPETGFCAINLYCCRPRAEWPWLDRLTEMLNAKYVSFQRITRPSRLLPLTRAKVNLPAAPRRCHEQ